MDDDRDVRGKSDPAGPMSMHVNELDLSVRAHNCLRRVQITRVSELVRTTPAELLAIRSMGRKTVREVDRALDAFGLRLGMPADDSEPTYVTEENVVRRFHDKNIGVHDILSMQVDELPFTVRASNCLQREKILCVADLVRKTSAELLAIQNMGVTSVHDIQRTLSIFGLRLGMSSDEVSATLSAHSTDTQDCDAFLDVMNLLARSGVRRAADVTRMTSEDILALPGLGRDALAVLENGLRLWGLYLCPISRENVATFKKRTGAFDTTGGNADIGTERPESVRDELTDTVTRLLEDVRGVSPRGFLAHHGVDGAPRSTLQEIGDAGNLYGFSRPVTRERVRQVLTRTERRLMARSRRARFDLWKTTVETARHRAPASAQIFVSWFGYRAVSNPDRVIEMLRRCANIFKLEFPFDVKTWSEIGSLVVVSGQHVDSLVSRLREAVRGPYVDLAELSGQTGAEADSVARIVAACPQFEFLDDTRRYLWKRPYLPPRNFTITGNAILTSLCKVFSVAARVTSADLALSLPRDRMFRKAGSIVEIPLSVLEGVAEKSGLFETKDGQITKKTGNEWSVIGQRDLALLAICAEHGRVVPSHVIYSGLVRFGLTRENAAAVVAYSPFLVHTQPGIGHREGIYKFVVRPDDIDLDELRRKAGLEGSETTEACMAIPVSSRTRLSGRFFAPEPVGPNGEWVVRTRDGLDIGRITISGRTVSGLVPVIDALRLTIGDVLEMRLSDERGVATVSCGQ